MGSHFKKAFLARFNPSRWDVAARLLLEDGSPSAQGYRLLDIGTAGGKFALNMQVRFQQIYGIDIRAGAISSATKLAAENSQGGGEAHFIVCDASKGLCFIDAYFDAVTILATLEHISEYHFVIREVNRVLKENGILILQAENRGWLLHRLRLLRDKKSNKKHPEIPPSVHPFRLKELHQLLEENGFRITKVTCGGLLAPFRSKFSSLLSADLVIKCLKQSANNKKTTKKGEMT